jgi:SAM-dependent methyltransferase
MEDYGEFSKEEVAKHGEQYIEYYKSKGLDITFYGNWQKDFAKLLIQIAELDPYKEQRTVLDVGCACALNLRAIDELGIFSHMYGVDQSEYLIDLIPNLHDFGSYADFYAASSWDLSMIDRNEIDFLICTQVLEHLPDEDALDKTLKEFKRVLSKDGKILIMLPCAKEEGKSFEDNRDVSDLHILAHTDKWWTQKFKKYFKSETFKARTKFKKSELRPDRNVEETFYEQYHSSWHVFKYIHK